jgi:hypothetical protein
VEIPFNMPHVFYPGAPPVENAQALRILLDCLINLNRAYRRTHLVTPLLRSGVRYGRTRLWEPIPALRKRGYGDCKSLTADLISEYREAGEEAEPVFRFVPWNINPRKNSTDFHILVYRPRTGKFEDPSKWLGMGSNENAHFISTPID